MTYDEAKFGKQYDAILNAFDGDETRTTMNEKIKGSGISTITKRLDELVSAGKLERHQERDGAPIVYRKAGTQGKPTATPEATPERADDPTGKGTIPISQRMMEIALMGARRKKELEEEIAEIDAALERIKEMA